MKKCEHVHLSWEGFCAAEYLHIVPDFWVTSESGDHLSLLTRGPDLCLRYGYPNPAEKLEANANFISCITNTEIQLNEIEGIQCPQCSIRILTYEEALTCLSIAKMAGVRAVYQILI